MKKAIVTGAAGFAGSALVRELLKENIEVLAIGRKQWQQVDSMRLSENDNLIYVHLDMADIADLHDSLESLNWVPGDDCVFYNFAWGGASELSDLSVNFQLKNVEWSEKSLTVAGELGCTKFIHVGTMEELFAQKYLALNYRHSKKYNRHIIYAMAKIASRNVLKMNFFNYKIGIIISTNSHIMGPGDGKDSFLQVTLQKLIDNEELCFSSGEQIFDVISLTDCAKAYSLIGKHGIPNKEYWVGSGNPRPLRDYVEEMAELYPSSQELKFGGMPFNDVSLNENDFSILELSEDTGFQPSMQFSDVVDELHSWLSSSRGE